MTLELFCTSVSVLYDQDPSKPNRKIDDMRLLNRHGHGCPVRVEAEVDPRHEHNETKEN